LRQVWGDSWRERNGEGEHLSLRLESKDPQIW
jgi:hypothetical protein